MDIIRTFAIAFRTQGASSTINTLKRFNSDMDKADRTSAKQRQISLKDRQFDVKETTRLINQQKSYIKDIQKGSIIFDNIGKKDAALSAADARLKSLMGIREDQRDLLNEEQQAFFDMQKGAKTGGNGLMALSKGLALITAGAYAFKKAINWTKYGEDILFAAHAAGVAAGEFQKVSSTAIVFGGTRQGTSSAMAGINAQLTDLKYGRTQSNNLTEGARLYGISYGRGNNLLSASEIYQNALKALATASATDALDIQKLYGIQQGEFSFIRRNGYGAYLAQSNQLQAEGFAGISEKSINDMSDLQIQFRNAMTGFTDTFHETLGSLIPLLKGATYILDGFNKLYRLVLNIENIRGEGANSKIIGKLFPQLAGFQSLLGLISNNPLNAQNAGQIESAFGNNTTNNGNTFNTAVVVVDDKEKAKNSLKDNLGNNGGYWDSVIRQVPIS